MIKFISKQKPMTKIGTNETELKYVLNLERAGNLSAKDVVEFACQHTGMQATMVKAALESCFQTIGYHVALGYRVKLGELGTFYPTISSKVVDSNTEAGLSQLEGLNIRFRPSADLVEKLNKAPKELTGIYKLVDVENKFYKEVGTTELENNNSEAGSGDNPSQDTGGGNTGNDDDFSG